jgi:Tfp pilus assembly protein PilN
MINLLPPSEKKEREKEKKIKFYSLLAFASFLFFLSLSLIFLAISFRLKGELETQLDFLEIEEKKEEVRASNEIRAEINSLNQKIKELNQFYEKRVKVASLLEKISQLLPPEHYLTNLSWQKETLQLALFGFSSSRDSLLQFKAKLEQEKIFQDVDFPPSNWVKPRDIDFQIILKIKKDGNN